MRCSLIHRPPQLIYNLEREPLIRNQWVRDSEGKELGRGHTLSGLHEIPAQLLLFFNGFL